MSGRGASTETIRVLIVDDHQVVRQGLRTFLELHDDIVVVGEAGDGTVATNMVRDLRPHVVLMDLVMVIVVGFVLFFQSSTLFVVAVATVPLSTGIVWAFSKPFARRYRRLRGEAADVQSGLVEAVGGIAAIKAMNAQAQAFEDFEKRQMKAIWTGYRLGIFRNVQGILVGLVEGWGSNVLFWVGSWFILKGSLSLGQLIFRAGCRANGVIERGTSYGMQGSRLNSITQLIFS